MINLGSFDEVEVDMDGYTFEFKVVHPVEWEMDPRDGPYWYVNNDPELGLLNVWNEDGNYHEPTSEQIAKATKLAVEEYMKREG